MRRMVSQVGPYIVGLVQSIFVVGLRRPNAIAYAQLHVLHSQTLHDEVFVVNLRGQFPCA